MMETVIEKFTKPLYASLMQSLFDLNERVTIYNFNRVGAYG